MMLIRLLVQNEGEHNSVPNDYWRMVHFNLNTSNTNALFVHCVLFLHCMLAWLFQKRVKTIQKKKTSKQVVLSCLNLTDQAGQVSMDTLLSSLSRVPVK